jgi:Uma2 family endonuclease
MQAQDTRYYSPEEYLELETASELRHEYIDGEIVPMTGGSANHNRILRNLTSALDVAFEDQDYEVFVTDLRLWIPKKKLFTYPDVMVVAGELEFLENRTDTITNSRVIIEVLSDSTKNYDRGEKFEFYRTLESLQEYVLIDQYKVHVEQFSKTSKNQWLLTEFEDINNMLSFSSVPFQIALSAIYRKVKF